MKIKIFGKESCDLCQSAKKKIAFFLAHWNMSEKVEVTYFDMDSPQGLAEGAFYDVGKIPTIIAEKEDGRILKKWEAQAPLSEEMRRVLQESGIK